MLNSGEKASVKNKAKKPKKATIKVSKEDWKAIRGLAKAHSVAYPLNAVKAGTVAAIILHMALERLTPTDIKRELDSR